MTGVTDIPPLVPPSLSRSSSLVRLAPPPGPMPPRGVFVFHFVVHTDCCVVCRILICLPLVTRRSLRFVEVSLQMPMLVTEELERLCLRSRPRPRRGPDAAVGVVFLLVAVVAGPYDDDVDGGCGCYC